MNERQRQLSKYRWIERTSDLDSWHLTYFAVALIEAMYNLFRLLCLVFVGSNTQTGTQDCMHVVGQVSTKTENLGNDGACMQCDPANNVSWHPVGLVDVHILSVVGNNEPFGPLFHGNVSAWNK